MGTKNNPAVSVIIPMYNAEKYVGFCLESVLVQTFTDYEIIVVDDCSTDNSCAVVESYKSMFGGKLKLIRSKKNSGSGGTPRNIGVKNSCGEYLFFLDSDDFITETALEELYPIAKDFDADVVDCQKYFELHGDNVHIGSYLKCEFVDKPTLITDDIAERVYELQGLSFVNALWTKLIRRNFFVSKNFKILDILGEDAVITWCMVCTAKNYVRVPNIVNFYRVNETSISNKSKDISKTFHTWLNAMTKGFRYLDEFLSKQEFFKAHLELKYIVLERLVSEFNNYLLQYYSQIDTYELYEIVRKEFSRAGDEAALMAYLFSRMNLFNTQLLQEIKN